MKRVIRCLAMMMVLVLTLSCGINVSAKTRIKLIYKKKATVYVGDTVKLKIKNAKKKVKWTSSNKSVATVSKKGVVKGKKAGKAKIIAKVGKKKLKCIVTVKKKTIKQRIKSVLKKHGWSDYDSTYGSYYVLTKYTSDEDGGFLTSIRYFPSSGAIRIYLNQQYGSATAIAGVTINNLNDRYCTVSFMEQSLIGFGTGKLDKQNASSASAVKFDAYTIDRSLLSQVEEMTGLMIKFAMRDFNSVMRQYGEKLTYKDLGFRY